MRHLLLLIFLAAHPLCAQKKIKTIEVSDSILFAAVDRPGDFYIVTKNGQMQKFDGNGKLQVLYKNKTAPTAFDPRDGARLFAYYRDTQQYEYLSPSFEITSAYYIDSAFVIQPWLICTSGPHKLWVLDAADHSLKKINNRESVVEVEVLVDTTLINDATHFTHMREYQGFVFLLNPQKGIYVFNGLGKHIKTLPVAGLHSFNFLGEELYYLTKNKIIFMDLFTSETREMLLDANASMVIVTDTRLFLIQPTSFDIFEFQP